MATREQVNSFIEELGALAQAEYSKRIVTGKIVSLPSVCIAQSACETACYN